MSWPGETTALLKTKSHVNKQCHKFHKRYTPPLLIVACFLVGTVLVLHFHPTMDQESRQQTLVDLTNIRFSKVRDGQETASSSEMIRIPPTPSQYTPEALKDLITWLPGLPRNESYFNMFSGYLTVSETNQRHIFYWYVESQGNPATDPLVFWTNGGPGCSGMLGFGQEHGPYHISADGRLTPNPYSWNRVANILYVEQPAGAGFSYSETPSDTVNVGDEEAASDNVVAIKSFLKKFPERVSNDFYIASESYGGHYVPQLAKKIVDRLGTPGFNINLKGFLVGNPWVDPFTNDVAQVRDFYQHGLISRPMFEVWMSQCSERVSYDHKACPHAISKMRRNMRDISPFALDYPVCTEDKVDLNDAVASQVMHFLNMTANAHEYPRSNNLPRFLPPDERYLPCAEEHLKVYLNQRSVQRAIHVRHIGQRWHACAPEEALSYRVADYLESQIDLYKELIVVAQNGMHNLSMLVFSGDNDSVCSTSSTQAWIYDLGVDPLPDQDWREWRVHKQTAGFVTRFDLGNQTGSRFLFATVHGAGHEVPAYRPVEALKLFQKFLSDEL